jgi:aminopeptidase N
MAAEGRKTSNLFQTEAIERASKIASGVDYQIFLHLAKGQSYTGYMHINFETKSPKELFLDYCGDKVTSIMLNGEQVTIDDKIVYNGHIFLPQDLVKEGRNLLEIGFENRYFTDGNGLHTFTDVDGKQYLYIQSEPYWNNRVLPLFDQPDIKGYFNLTVLIPSDWILITSEDPSSSTEWKQAFQPINGIFHNKYFGMYKEKNLQEDLKLVHYPKSKLLPSYLFSFACGPYTYFELPAEKRFKNIPMRIYCRETMQPFIKLQSHQFFSHHKAAIEYYENIFGMDFMFNKSDMIICPEYTIGAMEYPGAITYSENLFARGAPSIREVTLAGRVGMHELSHMWFGDCVTSYWWNDTWLKESFADFCAYLCSYETSHKHDFEIENAWILLMIRKKWGYDEDSKSTTHPIAAEIKSTEEADGVFDGISYAKGAGVMKQLIFVVGFENWSKAMKVYFERRAWKNAKLQDLIDVYQEVLGGAPGTCMDINQWRVDWLETPGTNIISADWSTDKTAITFTQGYVLENYPKLRFHKIKVTLYDSTAQVLESRDLLINNTETTVHEFSAEIMSKTCGILLNDDDQDFIKVNLDHKSIDFFKQNINKIKSELSKACIYKCFFDMVDDAKLKAKECVEFVINSLNAQDSITLTNAVLIMLKDVLKNYLVDKDYRELSSKLFNKAFGFFKAGYGKTSFETLMFGLLIEFATTDEHVDILKAIYDGCHTKLLNLDLNITNKWSIVKRIYFSKKYPKEEKERYYKELWDSDPSDTKTIAKAQFEVWEADTPEKLAELHTSSTKAELPYSYKVLQYKLAALNDYYFPENVRAELLKKYFANIDILTADRSRSIAKSYNVNLFPKCDDLTPIRDLYKAAIDRLKPEVKFARKLLTIRLEDIEIIMRNRAMK